MAKYPSFVLDDIDKNSSQMPPSPSNKSKDSRKRSKNIFGAASSLKSNSFLGMD